jgi:hypothetical protein
MAKTKAMLMKERYYIPYSRKTVPSVRGIKRRRIVLKRKLYN